MFLHFVLSMYQIVSGIAVSLEIQIKAEIHHHQRIQPLKFKNNGNTSRHHILQQITISFCLRGKMYSLTHLFLQTISSSLLSVKDSKRTLVNFSHKEVKRRKFSHFFVNAEKKNSICDLNTKITWFKIKTELRKASTYFDKERLKIGLFDLKKFLT